MAKFDTMLPDKVGTIDFSKYVNLRALLKAKNWPAKLVPLDTIADALDIEFNIRGGWRPSKSDLKTAPTLTDWRFVDHTKRGQGIRLEGLCRDHPVMLGRRFITTSHIVAMDLDHFKWVRTLSRFYKLNRFSPS